METQPCPQCNEENPHEAVMCWACYEPLGATRDAGFSPEAAIPPANIGFDWRDVAAYAAMAGLVGSGWLPLPLRWPSLGAAAGVFLGPLLLEQWKKRATENKDKARQKKLKHGLTVASRLRIAESVLLYAPKDRDGATRVTEDRKSVRVHYFIDGEWREQMVIPHHVWKPLRQQILRWARQGEFKVRDSERIMFEFEGSPLKLTYFRAQLEADGQGETLEIWFQGAPPEEPERAISFEAPPDVECLHCEENNAPDAVWCWNCCDDLKPQIEARATRRKYPIFSILVATGLAIATASGWQPRRACSPVLSVCALIFALPFALDKSDKLWDRKVDADNERRGISIGWEATPVRLVNTILLRALQESLPAIRLQERGNVVVSYEIDGDWQQNSVLPAYVWLPLRNELLARRMATMQGKKFLIAAKLQSDANGETPELRIVAA